MYGKSTDFLINNLQKIQLTAIIFMYIPCIFIVYYLLFVLTNASILINIINYITSAQQAKMYTIYKNMKLKL
jgi:hypothetical protein